MRFLLLIIVALTAALTACQTVTGSGSLGSETRDVSDFSRITLDMSGDVILTQADEYSVLIEAEDNILPYITTDVRNGNLTLSTQDNTAINTTRSVTFWVSTPNIEALTINGSGTISSEGIMGDKLALEIDGSGDILLDTVAVEQINSNISGSGDIEIEGSATTQKILIDGAGNYKALDLISESTVVNIAGSGSADVWATELLSVDIDGSGEIRYQGAPRIDESIYRKW